MIKHIKIPFVSQFSKKAGQGKVYHNQQGRDLSPSNTLDISPFSKKDSPADVKLCKHIEYCTLRRTYDIEKRVLGCSRKAREQCRSRRYYDRYGEDPLGVGS